MIIRQSSSKAKHDLKLKFLLEYLERFRIFRSVFSYEILDLGNTPVELKFGQQFSFFRNFWKDFLFSSSNLSVKDSL